MYIFLLFSIDFYSAFEIISTLTLKNSNFLFWYSIISLHLLALADLHFWDHEVWTVMGSPSQPAPIRQHPTRSNGPCCPCKDLEAICSGIKSFDIIHHRFTKIIVQLGKVVPNCTRYTSSQTIPDQIRRIFLKTRKAECSQCKQRKTWRQLWYRNLTASRQGGVCVGEFILSPHSSAVHYAGPNHLSITGNCWTSFWSK
jgi:hypothetical protein